MGHQNAAVVEIEEFFPSLKFGPKAVRKDAV